MDRGRTDHGQLRHAPLERFAILCLVAAVACQASDPPFVEEHGTWHTGVPLPEPLQELQAAVYQGAIWVAGGFDSANAPVAKVYRFDLASMEWTREADLPEPRHHMPIVVAGDSLYAVGGYGGATFTGTTTLWVYRPDTETWSARAALPQPRGAGFAASFGGRLYLVGGLSSAGVAAESLDVYDPATNSWARRKPIPTPRDHLGGGAVGTGAGGFILAAGGRFPNPLGVTERYDITADAWSTAAPMPAARGGVGSVIVVIGGKLHVLGGEDAMAHNSHLVYDLAANSWDVFPEMPTARHGLAVAEYQHVIYAIGGGTQPGFGATNRVELFVMRAPLD